MYPTIIPLDDFSSIQIEYDYLLLGDNISWHTVRSI